VTFPFKGVIKRISSIRNGSEASFASLLLRNYKYNFLLIVLFIFHCILQPASSVPEDEAKVIREILRENGYSVDNNENVDKYLGFRSSNPEVDLGDLYYINLPATNKRTLILSDKFNMLNPNRFMGVYTINHVYEDSQIDSVAFISNSIIKIPDLNAINNLIKTIPKEISHLRTRSISFGNNKITTLPNEIMQIFDTNYYNGGLINIGMNKIDTLLLSDTMKTWLSKYAYGGSEWRNFLLKNSKTSQN
jgi:hypothetical protein